MTNGGFNNNCITYLRNIMEVSIHLVDRRTSITGIALTAEYELAMRPNDPGMRKSIFYSTVVDTGNFFCDKRVKTFSVLNFRLGSQDLLEDHKKRLVQEK